MIGDGESRKIIDVVDHRLQVWAKGSERRHGGNVKELQLEDPRTSHSTHVIPAPQLIRRKGPEWRRQSVREILINTPFLRGIDPKVRRWCGYKYHLALK